MPPEPDAGAGLAGLVVARGAAFAAFLAIPAALANSILADQVPKPKGALNATFVVLMLGFLIAGLVAGNEAKAQLPKHGAAAAVLVFIPVQLIGIGGRLDRGDGINLFTIVFVGMLAACLGTVGAQIAARRRMRRHHP